MSRIGGIARSSSSVSPNNELIIEVTSIDNNSTPVDFPDASGVFKIFHQTTGGILYYSGESNFPTTSPKLEANEVLEIEGDGSFTLYAKTSSGVINLFVQIENRG